MRIAVCIKQVPSSEARIAVSPQTNQVDLRGIEWVISPYDEYALEEALRIRERLGGTVVVVSLGPERARNALKTALATGADSAFLISDPATDDADSFVTALVLSAFLRREWIHPQIPQIPQIEKAWESEFRNLCEVEWNRQERQERQHGDLGVLGGSVSGPWCDLILFGMKAIDDDMGYVGIAVAELLDLPHVSSVTKLEIGADGKSARVHREIEGATEVIETPLPAVLTAQKGLNTPRYPSLPGMMKAGKKPIPVLGPADLGLDPTTLLPRTRVLKATLPPERKGGRIIEGTPPDAVRELVKALREEAKVI